MTELVRSVGSLVLGITAMNHPHLLLALFLIFTSAAGAQDSERPLSERERAAHALSRLSFGARPGQVDLLIELGVEAWIEEQLESKPLAPTSLVERLQQHETLYLSPAKIYSYTYYDYPANPTRKDNAKRNELRNIPTRDLLSAVLLRATFSERELEEVLVDFWRNHLNVSFTKGWPAGMYIPSYEYQVIQGNVLRNFPYMLRASAHHPAMMHYLDNHLSRRPPSKQKLAELERKVRQQTGSQERGEEAAAIAAQRGLNENYARELMELHTLGVDRTYRQKDVIAVAEALTGWGLADGREGDFGFAYDPERHILGDKKFLGYVLRRDKEKGPAQGEKILEVLTKHDDTAGFIAHKLVRYLVNDVPPESLVRAVARTYKKTSGDIPAMVRTIVRSDEFWERRNFRAKFKTPFEFVVSALRATGADVENMTGVFRSVSDMGQPIYHCDDPTGYYDTAEAWLDPGVMAKRWQFALDLANGRLKGVTIPDSFFGSISADVTPLQWLRGMVEKVLPAGASTRTLAMLHEVVREHTADSARPNMNRLGPLVLGLLLGSPEFQEQ